MKKLILGLFLALAMMAFTTNIATASDGVSEPTQKCGADSNDTVSKCGTGKCGAGKCGGGK
jgi:uncharacterized low-complexity protein